MWTSEAVRDLIDQRFGKTLGLSTVQLYLQRWGMTPQKPLARAKERSPAAVAAWLATTYPAIAKRARAEGAAIYWGATTEIACRRPNLARPRAREAERVDGRIINIMTKASISAVSKQSLMFSLKIPAQHCCGVAAAADRRLS